jgi:hypothetical protein
MLFSGLPQSEFQERNARGLDYAFSNPVFQKELANLIVKVSADLTFGPVGGLITRLELKFKAAWDANAEANNGNYLEAVNDTTRIFLGVFVETFGSPALAYPLDVAKIGTAFASAYTYGFFWGV